MAAKKTVELETENQVETDTLTEDETSSEVESEETESQADESTDTDAEGEGEDVEKQESDYYEAELKRLKSVEAEKLKVESQLEEKRRQLAIKDRALQAEKKKPKADFDRGDIRDELKREILNDLRVENELERISTNANERQLVSHHYANSIVKTGNVKKDLQNALAIANAGRLQELLARQSEEDSASEASAGSMIGGYNGNRGPSKFKTPARKAAEEIVKRINPQAVKHLDNYLPR